MTISIHNERWGMTRLPLVAAVLIITATLYIVFVSTVVFLSSLSENAAKTTRWTPAVGSESYFRMDGIYSPRLSQRHRIYIPERMDDQPQQEDAQQADLAAQPEPTVVDDADAEARASASEEGSADSLLNSRPTPGLFHNPKEVHAVIPHLFRAGERYERRTLRELGGWSAAAQPKTPCWLETPADGAADEIHCFPGFYVLGAPKCGTSALFNVLRKHPRFVEPRGGKESHFWTVALGPVAGVGESGDRTVGNFTRANGADYARAAAAAGDAWPELLFGDLSPENFFRWSKRKVSDWRKHITTGDKRWRGTNLPWPTFARDLIAVPELLRGLQPAAKLVVILRDPVERAASQYRNDCSDCEHAWKPLRAECACPISAEAFEAVVNATAPVLEACFAEARSRTAWECNQPIAQWKARALSVPVLNAAKVHRRWLQWLQEGLYAETLRVWMKLFPKEFLLVLRYERLLADPRGELGRFFDHLGVTEPISEETWGEMVKVITSGGKPGSRSKLLTARSRELLARVYETSNKDLGELLGGDWLGNGGGDWDPP